MKKLSLLVLTLALAISMSITTFAAVVTKDGGTENIDINAKYVDSLDVPTVYNVDVTWGAMEFTYSVSGTKIWNPSTHQYDVNANDGWTVSGNEITVVNHSNTGIKAEFAYAQETGYEAITGSFSNASITLPTAEGKLLNDSALTGKTTFTLSGALASDKTAPTKVGSVTIKISKV